MATSSNISTAHELDLMNEETWKVLYPLLQSLAQYMVYTLRVSSWRGQEDDIVQDIVQETVRRIIEHSQRVECGEATPIHSLKHMIQTILCNYSKDIRRHDRRLVRAHSDSSLSQVRGMKDDWTDLTEEAIENAFQEELFMLLAHEIANFPTKQRRTLLIDLASRMYFDIEPTLLQRAFLKEGIQLQEYQQHFPETPKERNRRASLLSIAYKRLAATSCSEQYI